MRLRAYNESCTGYRVSGGVMLILAEPASNLFALQLFIVEANKQPVIKKATKNFIVFM
jgi:hypothetical protein